MLRFRTYPSEVCKVLYNVGMSHCTSTNDDCMAVSFVTLHYIKVNDTEIFRIEIEIDYNL
jgi:hypothetical protein